MLNRKVLFPLRFRAWIHLPKGAGSYEHSFECWHGYEGWCSLPGYVSKAVFIESARWEYHGPVANLADGLANPEFQPLSLEREPVFWRRCSCWDSRTPLSPFAWLPLTGCGSQVAQSLGSHFWSLKHWWIMNHAGGATDTWLFWGDRGDRDAPCSVPFSTSLLAVTSP